MDHEACRNPASGRESEAPREQVIAGLEEIAFSASLLDRASRGIVENAGVAL